MADLPEYNHFSELEVVRGPNRPQGDFQVVPVPLSTPAESWPPYHESKVNAERERSLWKRYRLSIVLLLILVVLIIVGGTVGGVLGGKKARKTSDGTSSGASDGTSDGSTSTISAAPTMSGTATPKTDYSFPTPVSHGYPDLDIFAIGSDEVLYHKYRDPTSLDDFGLSTLSYQNLGDTNSSQFQTVTAAWRSAADLDVSLVGGEKAMYHKYYSGITWGPQPGFEPRNGSLTTAPSVVAWDADRIDIFALGGESELLRQTWNKSDGWRDWGMIDGERTTYAPTAVSWAQGQLDVFVVGSVDHALYHHFANIDDKWQVENLGGYLAGRPSAVPRATGSVEVFVRGGDAGLWTTNYEQSTGNWTQWTSLGGDILGEPDALSWAADRTDVFVWNADFSVGHKYYDGEKWTPEDGFESLGGDVSGPPKAVIDKVGSIHVVGYSNKREVLYRSWNQDLQTWVPKDEWRNLGPPQ